MRTNTQKKNFMNKTLLAGAVAGLGLAFSSAASADSYTVQSGDTLSQIAANHQTTVAAIESLNGISAADYIYAGQVLEVGDVNQGSAATSTDTSASTTASSSSSLSAEDAAAKETIAQRESSGSYTAQNGQYYGRYQLTISYLNGDLSAENQEKVADAYVAGRYGSWSQALAFWNANGWY